jgi:hypothetical protein
MNPNSIPPDFSGIHYCNILGNMMQYCVSHSVNNHGLEVTIDEQGVQLKVQECLFSAIVEFHSPPRLHLDLYDPKRWWVGFVQNYTGGNITYRYSNNKGLVVKAAITPETIPCKDSGYDTENTTFYNAGSYGLKQFGVVDEVAAVPAVIPLPFNHPARQDLKVRYIEMRDAPGTGGLPLTLTCKDAGDKRAALNKKYTIGWTDPLDPGRGDQDIAMLRKIEGRQTFKTWLAMSSDIRDIHTTKLLLYMHRFEWEVNFNVDVNGRSVTLGGGSGARLISEGACYPDTTEPIVTGRDANMSVCVKFSKV